MMKKTNYDVSHASSFALHNEHKALKNILWIQNSEASLQLTIMDSSSVRPL